MYWLTHEAEPYGYDPDPCFQDFDDSDDYLVVTTAQFVGALSLTDGQRRSYDASWFRVRGSRFGDDSP